MVAPLARAALDPPLVPERLRPGRWLRALGRRGEAERQDSRQDVSRLLDALVPVVAEAVLERADLTAMVKRYVDLDSVVAAVDLDAAAKRIDVDAIVAEVDLDAAAARIDVDAVARRLDVDAVLDRMDLTAVVHDRVDLNVLVPMVLDRVDLDAVARRLDIEAVLDRIDLTAVVLDRVDLEVLVQAVLDRIDLPGLAAEVIDAVDLPEIIRESTGSMASDTVRGARMQGIAADETVARIRDRLLLRRNRSGSSDVPEPDERAEPPELPAQRGRER